MELFKWKMPCPDPNIFGDVASVLVIAHKDLIICVGTNYFLAKNAYSSQCLPHDACLSLIESAS